MEKITAKEMIVIGDNLASMKEIKRIQIALLNNAKYGGPWGWAPEFIRKKMLKFVGWRTDRDMDIIKKKIEKVEHLIKLHKENDLIEK